MAKGFCTLIVVPDAGSRLHKVRIPLKAFYMLATAGFASLVIVVGLAMSYASMATRTSAYNLLQAENLRLKVSGTNMKIAAGQLDSKLAGLETLSQRLARFIEKDESIGQSGGEGKGGSKADYSTGAIVRQALADNDIESIKLRAAELDSKMKEMQQVYENRMETMRYTPSIWPLKGKIGSSFGARTDPFMGEGTEKHLGIDISGPYGHEVHSSADGFVIFSGRMSDYGNLVVVDHGHGFTTRYAHLSRFAAHTGQYLSKGDVLGYVGLSGRTTGAHLHYEVRINDRPTNPIAYLPKHR